MKKKLIDGLVIGSRKCGTTWLYENFLLDQDIAVSVKVKESGFFIRENVAESDEKRYLELIDRAEGSDRTYVEVDASITYSGYCVENINSLASDAAVVLILRNPVDYLVSRITHSLRKGEIREGPLESIVNETGWLRDEINYEAIIDRFQKLNTKHKLLIPFELLEKSDTEFYSLTKVCLLKLGGKHVFEPNVRNRINIARSSRVEWLTIFITRCGKILRSVGLHGIVNFLKNTGVHTLVEQESSALELRHLKREASRYVQKHAPDSLRIWQELSNVYL